MPWWLVPCFENIPGPAIWYRQANEATGFKKFFHFIYKNVRGIHMFKHFKKSNNIKSSVFLNEVIQRTCAYLIKTKNIMSNIDGIGVKINTPSRNNLSS